MIFSSTKDETFKIPIDFIVKPEENKQANNNFIQNVFNSSNNYNFIQGNDFNSSNSNNNYFPNHYNSIGTIAVPNLNYQFKNEINESVDLKQNSTINVQLQNQIFDINENDNVAPPPILNYNN